MPSLCEPLDFHKYAHFRQAYKSAVLDNGLWKVLAGTLQTLLAKDWDERLEEDKLIIERILILCRNLLQVIYNLYGKCVSCCLTALSRCPPM